MSVREDGGSDSAVPEACWHRHSGIGMACHTPAAQATVRRLIACLPSRQARSDEPHDQYPAKFGHQRAVLRQASAVVRTDQHAKRRMRSSLGATRNRLKPDAVGVDGYIQFRQRARSDTPHICARSAGSILTSWGRLPSATKRPSPGCTPTASDFCREVGLAR